MRRMGIERCIGDQNSIPHGTRRSIRTARGLGDRAAQSGWCSDLTYLPMAHGFCTWCDLGRGESQSAVISALEHDDAGLLRRCAERSDCPVWSTRDRQHRSGLTITSKAGPTWSMPLGPVSAWMARRWIDNLFIERLWRLCAQVITWPTRQRPWIFCRCSKDEAHNEPIRDNIPLLLWAKR